MDIRELISFYHTARLSSVSQAARVLELGQPTVTAHLQRLEQEIGSDLFDRNKRPIKLTSQGAKLFELSRHLVVSLEQGLTALNNQMSDEGHLGSFSIGSYPDLAQHYLPPAQPPEMRSGIWAGVGSPLGSSMPTSMAHGGSIFHPPMPRRSLLAVTIWRCSGSPPSIPPSCPDPNST